MASEEDEIQLLFCVVQGLGGLVFWVVVFVFGVVFFVFRMRRLILNGRISEKIEMPTFLYFHPDIKNCNSLIQKHSTDSELKPKARILVLGWMWNNGRCPRRTKLNFRVL